MDICIHRMRSPLQRIVLTSTLPFRMMITMFSMFGKDDSLDVPPQEVKELLTNGGKPVLLDVREQWEYDFNRIEGAIHIPLADLPQRYQELDRDSEIIAYCHMGVRSLKAAKFLKQQGIEKVRNLAGGIEAWSIQVDSAVPRYR